MLALIFLFYMLVFALPSTAQNVGIKTDNPLKALSVAGSVMIDQLNDNNDSLDSSSLVFGSTATAGINSFNLGGTGNNLAFWTGAEPRMVISPDGHVAVGGFPGIDYRFAVMNGNAYFNGSIRSQLSASFGGAVDHNYKLKVHGNTNLAGTLFATDNVGIGIAPDPVYRFRVFGGASRLYGDVRIDGNMGIGINPQAEFKLRVEGDSYFSNEVRAGTRVGINGSADPAYRLRIYGGNAKFGGDISTTGGIGIGTEADPLLKLKVSGGPSVFNGSVAVGGVMQANTVTVTNDITIGGKGSVRSNGLSSLRVGFNEKTVSVVIGANNQTTTTASLADFEGSAGNVRALVSHIETNPGNTAFLSSIFINITNVDPDTDTCTLVIRNLTAANVTFNATIYLMSVAKD